MKEDEWKRLKEVRRRYIEVVTSAICLAFLINLLSSIVTDALKSSGIFSLATVVALLISTSTLGLLLGYLMLPSPSLKREYLVVYIIDR